MKTHTLLILLFAACLQASPPPPTRHVTDKAGVLTPTQIESLDKTLVEYESKTTNQLIVYVDKSLNGASLDDTIQWCHDWGIGKKGKDNGAALFLFINDRKSAIRTGYGMEASLPDATCKAILDDMKDSLRAKKYGDALAVATGKMMSAMDGTFAVTSASPQESEGSWWIVLVVVVVIVCGLVFFFFTQGGTAPHTVGPPFVQEEVRPAIRAVRTSLHPPPGPVPVSVPVAAGLAAAALAGAGKLKDPMKGKTLTAIEQAERKRRRKREEEEEEERRRRRKRDDDSSGSSFLGGFSGGGGGTGGGGASSDW